jgi:ankyrin repeat protein
MAGLVTWLVEALVEVARNDSVPEVQFFLSEGADVNGRDMHGRSAMHWSVIDGLQATTTLLLVCGANANESDTSGRGRSLLHKCVENGVENEGIAELLLLFGADIDSHNEMFQTPQDLAVLYHERHGLDDHLNLMLLLMSFRNNTALAALESSPLALIVLDERRAPAGLAGACASVARVVFELEAKELVSLVNIDAMPTSLRRKVWHAVDEYRHILPGRLHEARLNDMHTAAINLASKYMREREAGMWFIDKRELDANGEPLRGANPEQWEAPLYDKRKALIKRYVATIMANVVKSCAE